MHHYRRFTQVMYVFLVIATVWLINPALACCGNPETAKQAWPMIESGTLLVDVRSRKEFAAGHLDGAINIQWNNISALVTAIGSDKRRPAVFYCYSGNRAGKSIVKLGEKGYTNIFNATGLGALEETKP